MEQSDTSAKVASNEVLGQLPPHRKVTAFGRVWIEEDLLAYGKRERAAERALWQEMAAEIERLRDELRLCCELKREYQEQVFAENEACREVVEEFIRTRAHVASNAREALSEVSARIYKRCMAQR